MSYSLSLNTNPLVNRFAEPDDLIETIAREMRIGYVQLTHEFINPSWPTPLIRRLTRQMRAALGRTGVAITSGMTGPYGRLNHFGHPDADVRAYYVDWFKTFADIIAELGGKTVGTQFAILTHKDFDDPDRRENLIEIALECWFEVAAHAKSAGLDSVFWEPMSIGREFGETIDAALRLQARIDAANLPVPLVMMADIDHGDVSSSDPRNTDPYEWARAVATVSPIIQVKQVQKSKSGHRPFTKEFNETGLVDPEKLLSSLRAHASDGNEICLELSFKEREPDDRLVVSSIAESVAFWAPYVDTGEKRLTLD